MAALGFRFWLRLGLFISTLFIVINYLFEQTENQCQMTFMMEPPKFIPIPIGKSKQETSSNSITHDYSLFMYSEYGFPLENNVRKDLRDSMPVLFVPGNAGSYQQVRSLASTCIRRQLQSLDASKFVFYTIDFKAQLSGLSGDLIDRQISFVQRAVRKIVDLHPTETDGVIIVGHSVGGFIAKAVLTKTGFDKSLISLIINLGSPLTKPFINFDRRLDDLYRLTNEFWDRYKNTSKALSISISGGASDRLVPTHLSLDPQYDLSITTSSIDEVWLTTDHVSVTWCRELMNKLAQLLSALMDKKQTRLAGNKFQQLEVTKEQLITSASDAIEIVSESTSSEKIVVASGGSEEFKDFFNAHRNRLIDSPIIINMTNQDRSNLFIWVEHVESFRKNGIFGCKVVTLHGERSQCVGKINLSDRMRTIPSRRYELKKKCFAIKDESHIMNYLVLDYSTNSMNGETKKYKVPESISIQTNNVQETKTLYIPTIFEYSLGGLFRPTSLIENIALNQKQQVTYLRYELTNLNKRSQHYSIELRTQSCATNRKLGEMTALIIQDQEVASSFHPNKDKSTVIVKIDAHKSILFHDKSTIATKTHLDLFIDGSCDVTLQVKLDLWRLIMAVIQEHLSDILTLSAVISATSAAFYTPLFSQLRVLKKLNTYWLIIAFVSYDTYPKINDHSLEDSMVRLAAILFLANGLIALLEYSINRLVDLATIIHSLHQFIRKVVSDYNKHDLANGDETGTKNGNNGAKRVTRKALFDYEWLLIALMITGSFILSVAFVKLYVFFMLIKLKLKLSLHDSVESRPGLNSPEEEVRRMRAESFTSSLTTLCAFGLICYVPTALIKVNTIKMNASFDIAFMTMLTCVIIVKLICRRVEQCRDVIKYSKVYAHLGSAYIVFALCMLIQCVAIKGKDIRDIIYAEALVYGLTIRSVHLLASKSEYSKKETD